MKPLYFLACCSLSGCFGAGPTPNPPPDAKIVFAPPPPSGTCSVQSYVGDLVLAGSAGYAALLPYVPSSCNQTPGGNPQGSQQIYSFALDAGDPSGALVQDLGMTSADAIATVRLGLDANGPVWLWGQAGSPLGLGPPGSQLTTMQPGGSTNTAAGQPVQLWMDGGTLHAAMTMPQGGQLPPDPDAPLFPCCGDNTPRADMVYEGPVTTGQSPTLTLSSNQPTVFADLKQAFAVDSGHTYYVGSIGGSLQIDELGATSPIAMLVPQVGGSPAPVGLAAQGGGLALAVAPAVLDNQSPPRPGCEITYFQPAANQTPVPTPGPILKTARFSCMDVAIDPPYIYFAIVQAEQSGDCASCAPAVHGAGIGRVSLDGQTFESLALGVSGIQSGPRRIYLDSGEIYAVDPLAVVRIDETKLDGAHDFAL